MWQDTNPAMARANHGARARVAAEGPSWQGPGSSELAAGGCIRGMLAACSRWDRNRHGAGIPDAPLTCPEAVGFIASMSPVGAEPSTSWVHGLPLEGHGTGSFRVELAMLGGELQPLASDGRHARLLQARLAGPGGTTERRLVLKLQRDPAPPTPPAVPFGGFGNQLVEASWRREFDRLRRLSGRGGARLVAWGENEGRMPPVAFDRRRGTLFGVVGPRDFAPLQTCRDDVRLRQLGLEPWSTTTARFLAEVGAEAGNVVYTWSSREGLGARDGVVVRQGLDLFRDLAVAWSEASAERRQALAASRPDLAAVLHDLQPEDVASRIVPIAFYDAFAFCTEWCELHFGEFCDLAAGAPAEAVLPVASTPRAGLLHPLLDRLGGEHQWWSVPWATADTLSVAMASDVERVRRFALESTCLKLQAFVQVMQAVEAFHEQGGDPHFGVTADNVMMAWAGASMAPVRWGFRALLVDLGAGHRVPLRGVGNAGLGDHLDLPSAEAGAARSPQLAAACPTDVLAMRATAAPIEHEGKVVGLRIELQSRDPLPPVQAGDFVRVEPEAALPGLGDQPLFARVVEVRRGVVSVECRHDGPVAPWPQVPLAFLAAVQRFRILGPASDLFALGMLLARALLVTDERDAAQVREAWESLLDRLDMMSGGSGFADAGRTATALRTLLKSEAAAFGSDSVLWSREVRQIVPDPLPSGPWQRLLSLIVQMAIASPLAAAPSVAGGTPVAAFRRKVEDVLAELRVEWIEASPRATAIRAAVEALLTEQGGGG